MQAVLPLAVMLILTVGLLGMLIKGTGRLLRPLLGLLAILVLLSVFSDSIVGSLSPLFSTMITWAVRIAVVVAALYGIGAIIRILRNR